VLKWIAIGLSAGMFAFSAWIYGQSGDWVALVFMLVSAVYGLLFASGQLDHMFNRIDP